MDAEKMARELLAEQYLRKFGEGAAARVKDGPWTMEQDAAIRAIKCALSPPASGEESRTITALKVTLFEVECYLPSSIAKKVQAACQPASAAVVPEGWVLVPREPTPNMVHALATGLESRRTIGQIYTAMCDAAPTPPATAQEDGRDAARYRFLCGLFYIYGGKFSHDWRNPMGESLYYPRLWFSDEKLVGRDWLGRLISPIPHRPENEHETLRGKDVWPHIDALVDAAMLTSPDSGKEG